LALIQVFGSLGAAQWHPEAKPLDAFGVCLLLVAPFVLLWRRLPLLGAAAGLAATVAYVALDYPLGPVLLGAIATVFAAMRAGRRHSVWLLVLLAFAAFVYYARPQPAHAIAIGLLAVAVLTLGEGIRYRDAHFRQMAKARADRARARVEQERRQVSDERLRIARELHDVIGHHLSLINVQAGVGLHLMDEQPDQARVALSAIKQASAEALREVRGVLGALRPEDEGAPRTPAPSLAGVGSLIEDVRSGGLPVAYDVAGEPVGLPPEVDRAAYRIVQEALTNVRRHAGSGATARVVVTYTPSVLRVTVTDDGAGPVAADQSGVAEDGNGIVGMRERAAALGGELWAGPRPSGGFEVAATLPIDAGDGGSR
jgi:signal transduction histidine kinase